MTPEQWWAMMMEMDGPSIDLEVTRDRIDPGVSFSAEAMDALVTQMTTWMGTRVMLRWNATSESPTALRVSLTVEVQ